MEKTVSTSRTTNPKEILMAADPDVFAAVEAEYERQNQGIEMIASENYVSPAVLAAMGTVLTNKYAEGYPGHRYYGGCQKVDIVENLAIDRLTQLFGADHANVQPHSGAQANSAAYLSMIQLGDTVLGLKLDHGGHLTHGASFNSSGKLYNFVQYGVSAETGRIDYDAMAELAEQHRPKLIVAGASAYPRWFDYPRLREIADSVGARLMMDMAHVAGLVAARKHHDPVPYFDVVTSTTHKTLRGPRGGIILSREELAKKVDGAVFPGTQGGPLMHVIAGKAVAFGEALQPSFKEYIQNVLDNAQALAAGLMDEGLNLVSGGTDNHLVLVDLRGTNVSGKQLEIALDAAGIHTNKNMIPFDPAKPTVTSGVRLGTPAATTRGMGTGEMRQIAAWIAEISRDVENTVLQERVHSEVIRLCGGFPVPA